MYYEQAEYSNPRVPHRRVNATRESEVVVFFKLLTKVILIFVLGLMAVFFAIRLLTPYIPFSFEEKISHALVSELIPPTKDRMHAKVQARLQTLAEGLAQHMDIPSDMPIHVHFSPDPTPNAFATLGGNLIVNQGLIGHVRSENGLAMVIAHEVAHLKNRDPLSSLGTGVTFSILLATITGNDSGWVQDIIGGLTQLSFSRKQEQTADEQALHALKAYYGHTNGAEEFFQYVLTVEGVEFGSSDFFHTHPGMDKRLAMIRASQQDSTSNSKVTPLPAEIMAFKEGGKSSPVNNVNRHPLRRGRGGG